MTICMVMSARAIMRGEQTIGDFVLINALLMQLSLPLNFIGFVYREIMQGLVDIEAMFELLTVPPEVDGQAGRAGARGRGTARSASRTCTSPTSRTAQILKGISFEVPAERQGRDRRAVGRGQVDDLAAALPLLRRDQRADPDRRAGHPRRDAGEPPRRDRHGPAGHRALQRHDRLQHPLRPLGC